MLYEPPLLFYAALAAVIGGILLGMGSHVGGGVLVVIALILAGARWISVRRGEDETFTLW